MAMTYRPGVCNIGIWNRLGRLAYGIFFLGLSLWVRDFIIVNGFPFYSKVVLLIPFYFGFLGAYQALFGFCVLHSKRRTFDMR